MKMAKRDLSKTMNGDLDKQIDVIIKIMWAIRDDHFYFESYGKDIIKTLVNDWVKKSKVK